MRNDFESFFRSVHSIRLSAAEHEEMREKLNFAVRKKDVIRLQEDMDQEKFLTAAKELSLRADEKARMREMLFAEMERTSAPAIRPVSVFLRAFKGLMAALMLFVLTGAGVSYASDSALPGQYLYAVKQHVTEPLLMRFTASSEAKVRLQKRFINKRLEEAQRLAEISKLTAARAAIVSARLAVHYCLPLEMLPLQ